MATIRELRKQASKLGIANYGRYKKAELAELVATALQSANTYPTRMAAAGHLVRQGYEITPDGSAFFHPRTRDTKQVVESEQGIEIKDVSSIAASPFVRVVGYKRRGFGHVKQFDKVRHNGQELPGHIVTTRAKGEEKVETVFGGESIEGYHPEWLLEKVA